MPPDEDWGIEQVIVLWEDLLRFHQGNIDVPSLRRFFGLETRPLNIQYIVNYPS